MKPTITIAALLSLTAIALFAQQKSTPLNIKTGQWQSTTTITVSGNQAIPPGMEAQLTPAQRARMQAAISHSASGQPHTINDTNCITQEDLARDPFNAGKNDMNMKCSETLITSTATDAEVDMSCSDPSGNTSDFHITLHAVDNQHVTGKGQGTVNMSGQTMQSSWNMSSQWVQAGCPTKSSN